MRVITGTAKGCRLETLSGLDTRPTVERVKEGLFSAIAFEIEGRRVLDLFAGTGSMSYEFASRGAASVTSVEINAVHYNFIRNTARELGATNIYPIKANVFLYLKNCPKQFDIIFSDAPYDLENIPEIVELVFEQKLLREGGIFIFEHSDKYDFSKHENFWQLRSYGSVQFSIFKKD